MFVRKYLPVYLLCSFVFYCFIPCGQIHASDLLEDSQKILLQQSLTIYEIDQELLRLNEREESLNQKIVDTNQQIEQNKLQVERTRQHAGNTLRSYYLGQRQPVWLALFQADSFFDFIKISEYLFMILDNDRRSLQLFNDSVEQLQKAEQQLLSEHEQLQNIKAQFLQQKSRLIALEKEREERLAREKEAEMVIQQSIQLVENWKNIGLPLFRYYLEELSKAMTGLPNLLADPQKNLLTFNGLNASFKITDNDFNDFIYNENPNLKPLSFEFRKNAMVIKGLVESIEITLTGHYAMERNDDNETIIKFYIDQLTYDGYELPDTTILSLSNEFSLGFDPGKYAAFLEVTSLLMKEHLLTLQLKLKL